MLTDEDVIRIKRIKDCFTKLIELNRINFINVNKSREMHKVFGDIYLVTNMDEKIIYLLCVYIVNCDENMMVILNDTGILDNELVSSIIKNGIKVNEIISPVLKEYINNNLSENIISIIENLDKRLKDNENHNSDEYKTKVDYNLHHLKSDNVNDIEGNNKKLSKKIRRKILYDKYQGRY